MVVQGCVRDHKSLVNAMRDMDVVISTMAGKELIDQLKIVDAIKELGGTVKVTKLLFCLLQSCKAISELCFPFALYIYIKLPN